MKDRDRDRDRRDRSRRSAENKQGTGWALFGMGWGILGAVTGLVCLAIFTSQPNSRRGPVGPPEPERLSDISSKRIASYVSDNGIIGGALAAEVELDAVTPKLEPAELKSRVEVSTIPAKRVEVRTIPAKTSENGILLTHIRSRNPHSTKASGMEDALEVAQEELTKQLLLLEPPINIQPRKQLIRDKYLRTTSVRELPPSLEDQQAWAAANLDTDRRWVQLDVELTETSLRELRSESRSGTLLTGIGVLFAGLLALFAFLRLDTLTKGYLSWILGTVLTFAAIIAVIFFLRGGSR
ncbi:MAG: hypothetical protein ACRC8S_13560 [Fimbriiglobus sp.]